MAGIDQVSLGETAYELVPEIAPLFDNTKAYAVGDCVIKDAVLYRFTTAHAAGAWIGIDAEEITVGEEITDLKADLKQTAGILEDSETLVPDTNQLIRVIIGTSGVWYQNSTNYYSYMIPIPENTIKITVKANSTLGAVFAPLKTGNREIGTIPDYIDGPSGKRHYIDAGVESTIRVSGCKYLCVMQKDKTNDRTPESITIERFIVDKFITDTDEIGLTVDEGWTESYCILSTMYNSDHINLQGTTSTAGVNLSMSPFIPVKGKMLQIPMIWRDETTYPNYGMSLYDINRQPIYGRAVTVYINRTENDPYIVWTNIYLPKEAKYFRTTYWSETARTEYSIPAFTYNLLMEIPDEYKPITHELPVDTYMQNAIRRARQLTDIKWTPRVNIPRYSMHRGRGKHFLDWFYADHEYTGIPYSGAGDDETHWSTIKEWGYTHNWVGQHIPISAFVTAARYPNSIMGEKADQSIVSYDSSPYGDVCTALVNYVVDGPTPLRGINKFFTTTGDSVFRTDTKTIANSNMNDICIGDFLYTNAHVIFISDLMRDADGNVTHIEMSEETTVGNDNNTILGTKFGGVARRKMWEINEFKSAYGAYVRYRRVTFYGIPYIRSKYVDTGNESDMNTMVDMACIPYLGEGAVYRVNYIHNSKVLIGATGFTSLVVTKDGEPFNTFDITGLTEISVGFSEIGSYEAYLSDGTAQTIPCHWTVID